MLLRPPVDFSSHHDLKCWLKKQPPYFSTAGNRSEEEVIMNTQNYWNSILSSTSLRTLSTPLALYCKSYLAVAIGSGTADQVMRYSYSFTARMDESDETDNDRKFIASHTADNQYLPPLFGYIMGFSGKLSLCRV